MRKLLRPKLDHARIRGAKAARVEIEVTQMRVEIHMQPFAAAGLCLSDRFFDQRCRETLSPHRLGNHGVEEEGVHAAIPRDIDEADQPALVAQADPTEAVALDLRHPVILQKSVPEAFGMKRVQLAIGEGTPPFDRGGCRFLSIILHTTIVPLAAAELSNDLTAIEAQPYKVGMTVNLLQKGWYFTSLT